jgi:hypothetical protein
MTRFAFGAKCGAFGARDVEDGAGIAAAGAESFARRECAAMPARPTPQSRRNQRRESWRAWARRSCAERFMAQELDGIFLTTDDTDVGEAEKNR